MKRSATSAPVALLPNIADTVPLRAISILTGMRIPRAPSADFGRLERVGGGDPLLGQLESNSTAGGARSSAAALATTSRPGCRGATLRTPLGPETELINRTPSIGVPRRVGPCDCAHLADAAAALVARQGPTCTALF